MLHPTRNHGRALFPPVRPSACLNATPRRPSQAIQSRSAATIGRRRGKKYYYEPTNPLATELHATGVWRQVAEKASAVKERQKRGDAKSKKAVTGDKSRINVTSESLVKDVISYIGDSLKRHKGCDLISLYPGAGLWTKALHDAVQPRSHHLLEPDEDLYRPFLEPLLQQDGVRLIPKSGIVWKDLDHILTPENFPHQKEVDRDPNTTIERNDTLLVSINLAMYPKKKYQLFESLSKLVVYQLINSMRTSTLFQKYGRVRMLVWIPDDEKDALIPRTLHSRKRLAIEGELFSEYIGEVCAPDGTFTETAEGYSKQPDPAAKSNRRWGQLDLESVRQAMVRMEERKMVTPKGRETRMMQLFREERRKLSTPISPLEYIVTNSKKAQKEYDEMLAVHEKDPFPNESDDYKRFKMLKNYLIWRDKNEYTSFLKFIGYHEVVEAYIKAHKTEEGPKKQELLQRAQEMEAEFDKDWDKTPKYLRTIVALGRDQARMLFLQPPELGPVLSWDRRPFEPLTSTPHDFYPNIPCTLIDIQPKAVPAALRTMGPGTNNSGGIFDLILGVLLQRPINPVASQLDILWPGANDEVAPQLKSLTDPALGGTPLTGHGGIVCRAMNQYQMLELLDKYLKWPFRPPYSELVGRLSEERFGEEASEDDESIGGHASPDSL